MKLSEYINSRLKAINRIKPDIIWYGQNINTGSCLGGLTKGLIGNVINPPNIENSLCGFGMGLMLGEKASVYCVKQLDFLFLGIDHLINTWNIIKVTNTRGSFTILVTIVDEPNQGPQSSFTRYEDFCQLLGIEPLLPTNIIEVNSCLDQIGLPGFRIIGWRATDLRLVAGVV